MPRHSLTLLCISLGFSGKVGTDSLSERHLITSCEASYSSGYVKLQPFPSVSQRFLRKLHLFGVCCFNNLADRGTQYLSLDDCHACHDGCKGCTRGAFAWVLFGWGKQFMAIDLNFSKCFNQNVLPYKWEKITMCILEKL